MALPRDLSTTTEADIRSLVDEQATEGAYLDLKRDLPGRDAGARHEFLADVSAFANSAGGDLVYGLDEDGEGRAARIVPQEGNPDQETRRLQDMLMNGVQPRLPGVQIQPVNVDGGFVLVVRVPQSWAGPHRVNSNQHFFIRENGRKRQLDVPEIRGLFYQNTSESQFLQGLRALFDNECWLPRKLLSDHLERTRRLGQRPSGQPIYLTDKEQAILRCLASGASNAEIARLLHNSPHTVKTHICHLFRKLKVSNRVQAASWAHHHPDIVEGCEQ